MRAKDGENCSKRLGEKIRKKKRGRVLKTYQLTTESVRKKGQILTLHDHNEKLNLLIIAHGTPRL